MTQALQQSDLDTLTGRINGVALTPEADGYQDEVAAFNLASVHRPDVAVGAAGASDVQEAVRWAGARDLRVRVQATGHGAERPLEGGLLVNTRRMQEITIDPSTRLATLGAGIKWHEVLPVAARHGLAGLNGSSSDVGAIGYTLGGGMPVLGRTFGFASDRVRSFQVVTADGELRLVDAENHPDLFWGLRGGKLAAGIVTSMTIELVPLETIYGGAMFFPGAESPAILQAWAGWSAGLPDSMNTSLAILRLPDLPDIPEPLRGQFLTHLRVGFVGETSEGEALLEPMRAAGTVLMDEVRRMPITEMDTIHHDPENPVPFIEGSLTLRELGPDAVQAALAVAGPGVDSPFLMFEIRRMGGALGRAQTPDAVGVRDAAYSVFMVGIAMPGLAEAIPGALVAAEAEFAPYATGQSFVNIAGVSSSEEQRAKPWPAETYRRLLEVKGTYDPDDRFGFVHFD